MTDGSIVIFRQEIVHPLTKMVIRLAALLLLLPVAAILVALLPVVYLVDMILRFFALRGMTERIDELFPMPEGNK